MKKINILHIITGLGMGGAEKVVLEISKNSDKSKFNTSVIGLSSKDELLEEFLVNNIDTTLLKASNSLIGFIKIIKYINFFINKNNIQIIHAHMAHSIIISSIIKLLHPSLKIIFTSHNINIGSNIMEYIVWSLKPLRDIDIIFSKEILKFFYKSNFTIIPNAVEIEKYNLNLKKYREFTFISIGRLEDVKNHKFLIEIARELREDYNFKIQIVGDGYLKEELSELIDLYNLNNRVELLGIRNDIPILINQAHSLLIPSLWEGLPLVILEAGASRLPIIATSVGSIPSLLDRDNSYITELKEFKNQIIYVLENYNETIEKSDKLFDKIKLYYSMKSFVQKHEKVYLGVI